MQLQNKNTYFTDNVFAKIIRNEIPCKKVLENAHALAFHDINPQNIVHILVIPKGPYIDFHHFYSTATPEEILSFHTLIIDILAHCKDGKLESNFGYFQEIPHFHIHLKADKWFE